MKRLTVKWTILLTAVVLMLTVAAGSTVAYLITSDGPLENTFTPPSNGVTVEETLSNDEKKDVCVANTADYPVYVRAKVTIWWEAADAEHPALNVQDSDYTVSYGSGWTKENDGFYYYNSTVAADGETTNLINSIKPNPKPGYKFHVDIAAQTIQAEGMGTNVTTAQAAFAEAANTGSTAE